MHYYNDDQPDVTYTDSQGNVYTSHQRHSVVLQPTEYTLGLAAEYKKLLYTIMTEVEYQEI